MASGRLWLQRVAMLLALCAGSIASSAPPVVLQAPPAWTADPDEQFILDVQIHQLRLGDTVRGYKTPEGTCVVLGDFFTALDVPIRIDVAAKKASGWAFKEANRIAIDVSASTATYGAKHVNEPIAPGAIRETPDGWCVQTSAISRWLGIGIKPMTSGSVLLIQSDEKLPIELAMERKQRAARIHPAAFDLASLPQVRVPYRLWRAPALDFVVSGGITYRASDGARVDREASVYAAGEIARLSYDAQVTTTDKGKPGLVRVRAFRSDPDGQLLGPLHATHVGVGDVEGFDSRLTGVVTAGRGAVLTNRPLTAKTAFDHTRIEGDLPVGWEAELYRNGELLAFAKPDGSQRYVFDNVQLLYGENRIRVVLYGPQGQIKEHDQTLNVGEEDVPAGKTWYWIGANEPGRDLISLEKPPDGVGQPKAQATISVEHGLDSRTSVGVLARAMLINDQHLTFVEGTMRRTVGPAQLEISGSRESNGGTAAQAQLLGKFGGIYVDAEALVANDFHLRGDTTADHEREGRIALDAPLKFGKALIPVHAEASYIGRGDGSATLEAAARLSASIDRFNLGTALNYHRDYVPGGSGAPGETWVSLLGSGHIGQVRLRADAEFDLSPSARFKSVELSAYWTASQHGDWETDLFYDGQLHRTRARITHILKFNTFALSLSGEAASNGDLAFGFNLNFSLDPRRGAVSRQPLAQGGMIHATVFEDLNGTGVFDPRDPLIKGALITTGSKQAERKTDASGSVIVGGLAPYMPIAVGVDGTSLDDPMLTPKTPLQVVVPRPGVAAEVLIPLVGGGDIEGALIKSGELGFEGVDLSLIDAAGKTVATARTDFDGFFLFERVAYGTYALKVSPSSAAAAKIAPDLVARITVDARHNVIRLGSIQPHSPLNIAAVTSTGASAKSGVVTER